MMSGIPPVLFSRILCFQRFQQMTSTLLFTCGDVNTSGTGGNRTHGALLYELISGQPPYDRLDTVPHPYSLASHALRRPLPSAAQGLLPVVRLTPFRAGFPPACMSCPSLGARRTRYHCHAQAVSSVFGYTKVLA